MFHLVILAAIAQTVVAPSNPTQPSPNAKLANLVVTAISISTEPGRDLRQHYAAIAVRVRNSGADPACATLSAELHGPDDLVLPEIARSSTIFQWPAPPRISHLAHGDESTGTFVFETKDGSDPLDLVVKLDSLNTVCDALLPDLAAAAPEVRLDLRSLPTPPEAATSSPAALPFGGTHGYGTPLCLSCPRAECTQEAIRAHVQGTVILVVVVTAEGEVTDVHVQKGLGYGLDAAAIAAVSKWKLKPAKGPDGQPATIRQIIEVQFQL